MIDDFSKNIVVDNYFKSYNNLKQNYTKKIIKSREIHDRIGVIRPRMRFSKKRACVDVDFNAM